MKYKRIKRKYISLEIKDIYKSEASYEEISNQIKVRNPGIYLGRIISMYCIIIHHILLWAGGKRRFGQYNQLYDLDNVIN